MSKLAGLGLALARRGFLSEGEVKGDLPGAVRASMGRWMDSMWGGMRWFEFRAHLLDSVAAVVTDDPSGLVHEWGEERTKSIFMESCGIDPTQPHVGVGLSADARCDVLVGEGVRRLESVLPGFGFAVLNEVEQACMPYDLFGVGWLEWAAEFTYWSGMHSEQEWAEECGEPLEEYEGMKREDLEKAMPITASRSAPKVTTKTLSEIAAGSDEAAARAAGLLIQLRRLRKVQPIFQIHVLGAEADWYDTLSPTVLMGWDDIAAITRVGDDYYQVMTDGGADIREWVGLFGVPVEGQQALRELELRWKLPLKKLRLADALLSEIGREV